MSITQKDLARELGVSLITVSRALNDSGYVSVDLRKRINDYARKKSYVPHRASQILVRNKVRTIALFSATHPDYFWNDIKNGALSAGEYIKSLNYDVRYHLIPDYDTAGLLKLLKKEVKKGLDAAAFPCVWMFDIEKIIAFLEGEGIPYLFFNIDNTRFNRLCYIGADYPAGGALAAAYIGKALSLKKSAAALAIGVIEKEDIPASIQDINQKRLDGFLETMKGRFGGITTYTEFLNLRLKQAVDTQIGRLLKKYQGKADAVYLVPAYNTIFAGELGKLDYRRAITVVHDINDQTVTALENGTLTAAVYQDPALQGYMAVRTLESILESRGGGKRKDVEIAHTLIFRENLHYLKSPAGMYEG